MKQSRITRCVIGADTLQRVDSGIGRVGRLIAKVLAELHEEKTIDLELVAYRDTAEVVDTDCPTTICWGSRVKYLFEITKRIFTADVFFYDFLGMAQAHCRLPFFNRQSCVFLCGIEVWEHASPNTIKTARRIKKLLSISQYTKERALKIHSEYSRADVCWLATEEDEAPLIEQNSKRPPTLTILGRIDLNGYKGHREVVASWDRVMKSVPEARLIIAGHGPGLNSLKEQVQRQGLQYSVQFTGFVPHDKLPELWAETDAFAMPSRGEGFGLVYIEAMRQGKPVIASVHDAGQEINLHEITGLNVDLDHESELWEAIIRLLSDTAYAKKLGLAGQKRWKEHFSYSAFRNRFLSCVKDLIV